MRDRRGLRRLFFVYWKLMETFLVNKMFTD
ncbi:hypothetical protein BDL97_16G078100 [Sphagnum fallax]|nr:hypothetical protein BDL97_16G078100 [Sphagnum fallax]